MRVMFKNGMVFHRGIFSQMDFAVFDGRIAELAPFLESSEFDNVIDFSDCYILPGLADVHVHLREPGFSYKETIATGTLAAARGGFTAVCAMPNLDPAPDSPEALKISLDIIRRDAVIPVYPYACITAGGTGRGEPVDFAAMSADCVAFSDDGRGVQLEDRMLAAMIRAAAAGGIIAAHCEDEALLRGGYIHDGKYARRHGHAGICSESEWAQVERDIRLVERTGCDYHVCHVSAAESVGLIRKAKARGLPVSCETAPHYLALCEDDLQEDGRFKMNPPLRAENDRRALLEGISDGTIDMIATDHAPHSADEKARGLKDSAFGIVGLETAVSVLYTQLVDRGVISMEKLTELMSVNPRRRFRLPDSSIEAGRPADFAVFDPRTVYEIDPSRFLSMGRATPFAGMKVKGEISLTVCGGRVVYNRDGGTYEAFRL